MEKLKVGQKLKFITFFGLSGHTGEVVGVHTLSSTTIYNLEVDGVVLDNPIVHDLLVHAVKGDLVRLINEKETKC